VKNPPPPPANGKKPMTAKRQKIMALAMTQLKKTRAQMDPTILKKIRDIISNNPKVMKSLGIDEMPQEAPEEKRGGQRLKPVENPSVKKGGAVKVEPAEPVDKKEIPPKSEKIDQGKNLETIAKLMQLKPSEIKNIKSVLLKSKD